MTEPCKCSGEIKDCLFRLGCKIDTKVKASAAYKRLVEMPPDLCVTVRTRYASVQQT